MLLVMLALAINSSCYAMESDSPQELSSGELPSFFVALYTETNEREVLPGTVLGAPAIIPKIQYLGIDKSLHLYIQDTEHIPQAIKTANMLDSVAVILHARYRSRPTDSLQRVFIAHYPARMFSKDYNWQEKWNKLLAERDMKNLKRVVLWAAVPGYYDKEAPFQPRPEHQECFDLLAQHINNCKERYSGDYHIKKHIVPYAAFPHSIYSLRTAQCCLTIEPHHTYVILQDPAREREEVLSLYTHRKINRRGKFKKPEIKYCKPDDTMLR
jgi:hypothetical protein